MCHAKSSPYSKSNSSCPLFSAGHASVKPSAAAWRRMAPPNCSSTRMPALSLGTPATHGGRRAGHRAAGRSPRSSSRVPQLSVAANQVVGRAVMAERGLRLALELRDDALGQHLAQLDPPLIERVDVPDDALGEHAMLVECDELSERSRREPPGEDR